MSTGSPLSLKEFTIRDSLHLKELLDCVLVFTHACTAAARLLFPLVQSIEFPVHPKKKKKITRILSKSRTLWYTVYSSITQANTT